MESQNSNAEAINESVGSQQQYQDQENDRDKILTELTRANSILKANISTLYRTARAEIARKNDRIAELQTEVDNLLFKRMSRAGQSEPKARLNDRLTCEPSTSKESVTSNSQNEKEINA